MRGDAEPRSQESRVLSLRYIRRNFLYCPLLFSKGAPVFWIKTLINLPPNEYFRSVVYSSAALNLYLYWWSSNPGWIPPFLERRRVAACRRVSLLLTPGKLQHRTRGIQEIKEVIESDLLWISDRNRGIFQQTLLCYPRNWIGSLKIFCLFLPQFQTR